MADFLYSRSRFPPGLLGASLTALLGESAAAVDEHHGTWGSLAVARAHHDPPEVVRLESGLLTVLLGNPLVRRAGLGAPWYVGDRRQDVHQFLSGGDHPAWTELLDGHFALLAVDTVTASGQVVTDFMSHVPVYAAARSVGHEREALMLGSHPDALARAAGLADRIDLVTAAELVLSLRCTFPHTIYEGIRQLPPGSSRSFGPDGWAGPPVCYWSPRETAAPENRRAAAAELHEATREFVASQCSGHPEVGLLLSGGEDSRALLGAIPDGPRVHAFTYADAADTREARIAAATARIHRASFTVGVRARDHYTRHFETVARLVGSQHLLLDVHGFGMHRELGIRDLPVVLDGLSANVLFKGHCHAKRRVSRAGVPATALIPADLVDAVVARKAAFRDWVAGFRPTTAEEWMAFYPFSVRKHGGVLHGNRRLFRSVEPFHALRGLQVAAACPPNWMRGGWLFRRAMRPVLAPTRWLPHARGYFPYFGRLPNLVLEPAFVLGRAATSMATGRSPAQQHPWPDWKRLADSPAAVSIGRNHPIADTPLGHIFGGKSANDIDREVARWPALRRLMLLQLSVLHGRQASPEVARFPSAASHESAVG
ncbi:MAG: asparagine synthase-related protein [Gemmatimonadales bacterium]